jgi:hypothetical protein
MTMLFLRLAIDLNFLCSTSLAGEAGVTGGDISNESLLKVKYPTTSRFLSGAGVSDTDGLREFSLAIDERSGSGGGDVSKVPLVEAAGSFESMLVVFTAASSLV